LIAFLAKKTMKKLMLRRMKKMRSKVKKTQKSSRNCDFEMVSEDI